MSNPLAENAMIKTSMLVLAGVLLATGSPAYAQRGPDSTTSPHPDDQNILNPGSRAPPTINDPGP